MKRKSFVAVACAAAMIASMTSGLTVFAEETADFSGEELSILVSAGWMDNRYDATIERFEDTYGEAGWITDMMQQSSVLKILMV